MNTSKLEKLRLAANQFYLNKYSDVPTISDYEYDSLLSEYNAEGGSVIDLIEWEDDVKRTHSPLPKVNKCQVDDNDLNLAINNWIKVNNIEKSQYHLNYKYDGSSIIAYYNEKGQLYRILGTPDSTICLDRTRNCFNMFPHQVTPGIECIQGEFLVDASAYGQKARNKANGLLNSKDMINDLENEGFIRVYQMRFYDGNWSYKRLRESLNSLPILARNRVRPCNIINGKIVVNDKFDAFFAPAPMVTAPTDSIITEESQEVDHDLVTDEVKFQVDGAVIYYDNFENSNGYFAFKFYFTESAITTVTEIIWTKAGSGSWQPKLNFEPVTLNDKNISQAASGGYPNLQYMKMGKGAKIKVILSNMTIPKVIEVLEPSEDYQFPTCSCGHVLNPNTDLFGSGLKCTELDCKERYKDRSSILNYWLLNNKSIDSNVTAEVLAKRNVLNLLDSALNIDRWSPSSKLYDKSLTSDELYFELISLKSAEEFKNWIKKRFYLPGLCESIMEINYFTAYNVIKNFINK